MSSTQTPIPQPPTNPQPPSPVHPAVLPPKTKSLARKLSIIFMVLAMPIFVLAVNSFFRQAHDLLHQEAIESSNSVLQTTLQRVVNHMSAIETAAKSNAWLLEESFNPDSLLSLSRRIVSINRSVMSCSVSTEPDVFPEFGHYFSVYTVNEGDTVISMIEPEFDYFEKIWYKTALQTGKPCWVDPFSDFNDGAIDYNNAVASYCIPLRPERADGRQPSATSKRPIAGVVSVDFSFNSLAKNIMAVERPYPSSYFMLIGTGGRYLIHPDANLLFKKTIFTETDSIEHPDMIALGHEMTSGKKGFMHVTYDDKNYHVCYAPVHDTDWSLALVSLDSEVLEDYNHLTYLVVLIIIVGLLIIMWITSVVVKRNIKSVNQLLGVTEKIADGNYDEEIPHSDRKDMIAKLQNAFRDMQQSLIAKRKEIDDTFEKVRQQNEELEQAGNQAEESVKRRKQFVQNLLRQIQAPLNVIDGLTNVLRNSLASRGTDKSAQKLLKQEEMRNLTNTMKRDAAHLNRMILMLYDISQRDAAVEALYERSDMVGCNSVAQECLDYVLTQYPNVEIRLETEVPDSMSIQTNHLYLMRTIRELLYNAAKYSDGKHIVLFVTQTERTVRFTVEDKGPGLPKEWQQIIDQPFTKVEEGSEGLGLGLPLNKQHAVGLGGDLIYDATYQDGCRITVELPITVET